MTPNPARVRAALVLCAMVTGCAQPAQTPSSAPAPSSHAAPPAKEQTSSVVASGEPATGLALRGLQSYVAQAPVPEPDWTRALLSLYVVAETQSGQLAFVKDGATLHTGEKLSFRVRVGRPAYIYLIQVFPDGSSAILYPGEGEPELLQPGIENRVPTNPDGSFMLDDVTGLERVGVVASAKPISEGAPELERAIRAVRAQGAAAAPPPRANSKSGAVKAPPNAAGKANVRTVPEPGGAPVDPHPGPIDTIESDYRGLVFHTEPSGRTLDVQANPAGVAAAVFTFKHVP